MSSGVRTRASTKSAIPVKSDEGTDSAKQIKGSAKFRSKGQTTLDGVVKKTVTFSDTTMSARELEKERKRAEDAVREVNVEFKKLRDEKLELETLKAGLNRKIVDMEDRIAKLEKKVGEWEKADRQRSEQQSVRLETSEGNKTNQLGRGSQWSVYSGGSRVSLSDREVVNMKRMVSEQEKREKQNNIAIKGVNQNTTDLKNWTEDFILGKVGVRVVTESVWLSGRVVIAKLKEEDKKEVMLNKNKLAGSSIFIENDLPYEDRKRQEGYING